MRSPAPGAWAYADGAPAPAFDGCVDIDLSGTPFTNTLPIRRADLAARRGRPAVDLHGCCTYPSTARAGRRRRSTTRRSAPRRFRYEAADRSFAAELPVDEDGLVLDYPALFRRLPALDLRRLTVTATPFRTLDDAGDLRGKRVLVRVDLNVPMENGRVTDATRIERVLPTIREIAEKGGKVVLLAHFGRPKGARPEGVAEADRRGRSPGRSAGRSPSPRTASGEAARKAVDGAEGRRRAAPGEHPLPRRRGKQRPRLRRRSWRRSATSTSTTPSPPPTAPTPRPKASPACCRPMPAAPCRPSSTRWPRAWSSPQRPLAAVVGGAKVSTKIDLLENLVAKVDSLVIGGGMANTFLHAIGIGVGRSLAERDLAATAQRIIDRARETNCAIILPVDAVVAERFEAGAPASHLRHRRHPRERHDPRHRRRSRSTASTPP